MTLKAWSSTLLILCFSFAAWAQKAIATWKSRFRKAGEPALPIPFPETIICSAAKYSR